MMYKKLFQIFDKPFFKSTKTISLIWLIVTFAAILPKFFRDKFNNYLIYKNVFWHVVHQTTLYTEYPAEYFDRNHYGPIFSLVIAPFAVLPDYLGLPLWTLFTTEIGRAHV